MLFLCVYNINVMYVRVNVLIQCKHARQPGVCFRMLLQCVLAVMLLQCVYNINVIYVRVNVLIQCKHAQQSRLCCLMQCVVAVCCCSMLLQCVVAVSIQFKHARQPRFEASCSGLLRCVLQDFVAVCPLVSNNLFF